MIPLLKFELIFRLERLPFGCFNCYCLHTICKYRLHNVWKSILLSNLLFLRERKRDNTCLVYLKRKKRNFYSFVLPSIVQIRCYIYIIEITYLSPNLCILSKFFKFTFKNKMFMANDQTDLYYPFLKKLFKNLKKSMICGNVSDFIFVFLKIKCCAFNKEENQTNQNNKTIQTDGFDHDYKIYKDGVYDSWNKSVFSYHHPATGVTARERAKGGWPIDYGLEEQFEPDPNNELPNYEVRRYRKWQYLTIREVNFIFFLQALPPFFLKKKKENNLLTIIVFFLGGGGMNKEKITGPSIIS
ncbi:hypothetical protein RFI_08641 [Reticulomyxa filosa]|uniref:Uncharacterized protein n=1 Tax=Reticulomyxa filosa TaxID=46433 RepID=X6NR58_RETFI|nr:hypothetical protein RFI_08641 [Reticulomyxa filosa]|eukprot:ETO28491.1 hypothetical protein RFI_08641 [Reticulomyxa filosa]